jgi:hypothetical protein
MRKPATAPVARNAVCYFRLGNQAVKSKRRIWAQEEITLTSILSLRERRTAKSPGEGTKTWHD